MSELIDNLLKIIEKAPHGNFCGMAGTCEIGPEGCTCGICTCWKADALKLLLT